MDESLQTESTELAIEGMSCDDCVSKVEAALRGIPGVESVEASIGRARVVYVPQIASRLQIGRRLEALGYRIAAADGRRKGRFARWLERMARSNQESFGHGPLDCCTLDRKHASGPGETASGQ